jgi:hypothetical protein
MLVGKQRMATLILAMVTALLLTTVSLAAENPEPNSVTLQGSVSVLRDANDVVVSVQLITDKVTYEVVLDEKGIALGKEMDGKDVEVQGVVSEKDKQKWLTVQSYKAVEEQ